MIYTGNTYNNSNIINRQPIPQPGMNPNPAPRQYNKTRVVYAQKTTKNKSFLDMHHYLKSIGVKNNEFMLALLDPDLDGINPHDPNLNGYYRNKILRECICNYWYYLREVVRLPSAGSSPMMYKLDRGNLAYNFCASINLNTFFEEPRQCGKTTAVYVRKLYLYNFGTTNSKMAFLHKNMNGATDNLSSMKAVRDLLPPYLILKEKMTVDGKVDKGKNNTTEIKNPFNNNNIKCYASATNKAKAASLLRGKTLTFIWYDEYGFIPYNDIIYMNAAPAFNTASEIARVNGAPYGITITTTPGFMTSSEGKEAYSVKEDATRFSELWYDKTYLELMDIIKSNTRSEFIYIKYTYQQLGKSNEWFSNVCKLLKNSWSDIKREILLEWATGVDNSPFREEDLEVISTLIKQPISEVYIFGKYKFDTYMQANTKAYPPIIGVDVAGGYKNDSSCITVIDSFSTKVLGCLNCNYISTIDLARCIGFILQNWMPNAIVNVELNGGYGHTVVTKLKKMGFAKNLYYEIKEKTIEERHDGVHAYKQKVIVKQYGLTSTKEIRKILIDILLDRVENHKDKFISPIIYNELLGMEIKRNGKVEHSSSTHDDQTFSLLMALYVWYEGVDIAQRYGIRKTTIKTDSDEDEIIDYMNNDTVEIVGFFAKDSDEDDDNLSNLMITNPTIEEFVTNRILDEQERFRNLIKTPIGTKAYKEKYNIPEEVNISDVLGEDSINQLSNDVFLSFYDDNSDINYNDNYHGHEGATFSADDFSGYNSQGYNYRDHFNF